MHKKEEKEAPGSAQKTSKPSTMQEFLSQKKQMFLVELANTCLKQEIVNLERKTGERQQSLQQAKVDMHKQWEDINQLVQRKTAERKGGLVKKGGMSKSRCNLPSARGGGSARATSVDDEYELVEGVEEKLKKIEKV